MHEERRLAVLLQPLDHRLTHEARLGELDGKARRRPGRAVVIRAREPLHRPVQIVRIGRDIEPLRGEPTPPGRASLFPGILNQRTKPGQHALVAEQPRIPGRHRARVDRGVRVPEEHRVVARLAGQQRHVGEAGVQRRPVENGAIAVLVGARVEAGPRWSARCRVGPVVGEQDPAAGQGVEVRRLDHRMAECRQAVPTPLIERDEEDVARRRHATTLADAGHRRTRPAERKARRPNRGRAQDVRIDAPPSFVPNSINQAPRRGATARCTARPPGTGESGGRALHRRDPALHRLPPVRSPRSRRSHQILPVGIGLRLHCPRLDHPFTSLASSWSPNHKSDPTATQL